MTVITTFGENIEGKVQQCERALQLDSSPSFLTIRITEVLAELYDSQHMREKQCKFVLLFVNYALLTSLIHINTLAAYQTWLRYVQLQPERGKHD